MDLTKLPGAASYGFKNDTGGWIIKPLFFEYDNAEHLFSSYTLKEQDHTFNGVTYPSLRRLYVETEDPTEYLFSVTYLGGLTHWKRICQAPWFKDHLKEWREELELKLRAQALLRIKTKAVSQGKDSLQADKLLLSGGWKTEEEKTRGRPSKQKILEEAERLFETKSVHDEDFERLNLHIN